jgi:hypothetical protein
MLNFWKIDKMKNISHVEKKDYIWIYDSIPAFLKTKVTALMGYSQSSKFTQCKSISYEKFNILNDFAIKYDYKSTNKVGDPVEFDREQMQNYFKALNNYINSVDFQLLSGSEKNRVIDEQVVIHNQLFNE